MRYISVFSGIEAATVAWKSLGWEAVAFSEIEPFPCEVLTHHYPNVPNLGDITKVDWSPYANGSIDIVVGGSPCQSFSVAGRREGLDGASGLVRQYFRLLSEVRPRWFVWENVPGCLSSGSPKGSDFEFILQQWDELRYHVSWAVLDSQWFGVAQRRRRVFAIGHIGDWKCPVKVLFESEGVRGDPPPRRQKRQENPRSSEAGTYTASGFGHWTSGVGTLRAEGGDVGGGSETLVTRRSHWDGGPHPSLTQCNGKSGGIGMSDQELFSQGGAGLVAGAVSCKWAKGTGGPAGDECYNLVYSIAGNTIDRQIQNGGNGAGFLKDISYTLNTIDRHAVGVCSPIAFTQNQREEVRDLEDKAGAVAAEAGAHQQTYVCAPVAPTIGASGPPYSRPGNERVETEALVAHVLKDREGKPGGGKGPLIGEDKSFTLGCNNDQTLFFQGVRRLTPTECCRLQGFPDDYLDIEFRGKPAPDGAKYKALGNSMCVNVMRWIGERIQMVEDGKL